MYVRHGYFMGRIIFIVIIMSFIVKLKQKEKHNVARFLIFTNYESKDISL